MLTNLLIGIGLYTIVMWLTQLYLFIMSDRTGNSGRYRHWEEEDD